MRRAIATVSLSGTLRPKLEAIAAARFDAIELFEADFINFAGGPKALRRLADDLGLGIDLYQPFRDFEGMPDALFRRSLDRAERKFDLMQTLGAPLMLVCSNTSPAALPEPERAAAQLHQLAERAARRNLRIGFEALAWGRWVRLYRQAWAIVERAAHPHLGLILDSFHTLSLGDDPAGIAAIPGEKVFFLQMADAPRLSMDVLQWARHHRNFPGQGQLDCEAFLEQTLRAGYTGTLSLEIFNDIFRGTPNRRTALDAMRSLLYLESRVRARLARSAAGSTPAPAPAQVRASAPTFTPVPTPAPASPHVPTPTPAPAPAPVDRSASASAALGRTVLYAPPEEAPLAGFAFLEFGVDEAAAERLGEMLRRFGFSRYGRHRTKAVSLYRQGAIHLVLNAQPASDARARFDEQGAGVCAVGISTPEPLQAAQRASALLSARRDSPRGAHELELPAILAPGGTIVQFVSPAQQVESDFVAEAGPWQAASATVGAPPRDPTDPAGAVSAASMPAAAVPPSAAAPSAAAPRAAAPPAAAPQAAAPPADIGLQAVDHIAIGLTNDQFDTWVLFSRAVLGLTPGESLELADPFGLVRSCGVANPARSLRLVLNVSLGPQTRTARQLRAAGPAGASVHHIALSCDDIFETMTRLRARGAAFVPISANYYDDLLARLDIDEALVRRMQALDILYDVATSTGTGTGRYFHAYSERFDDRFFFEIIQRDPGYDAYGAVNASARMAAQEEEEAPRRGPHGSA